MPNGSGWRQAVNENKRLALKARAMTVRWCLRCDQAFRSTGVDHRLCNPCVGKPTGRSLVGARLLRVGRWGTPDRSEFDEAEL